MKIENEEKIKVGQVRPLQIVSEEFGLDAESGDDLSLLHLASVKISRPNRREWFLLKREAEFCASFLIHKPKADGIETEFYYVDPQLRRRIKDELKKVRLFLCYSIKRKCFFLWDIPITEENPWYESKNALLKQPVEFFQEYQIRVMSDKENSRVRVKFKKAVVNIQWPEKNMQDILMESLGEDRFITSVDHPIYAELVDGDELDQ